MNRISFLNYGRLPILATRFWAILATNDVPTNLRLRKKTSTPFATFHTRIIGQSKATLKRTGLRRNARSSIQTASSITRSEIMSRVRVGDDVEGSRGIHCGWGA
jgi:hypothetical protein